ncbi:MAG TPA: zf-HC2 domain-containing protein [Ilumatobacter sp.]
MIGFEWHIDGDDLAAYAEGRTGAVTLASVEAHLIACERCRSALSEQVHAGDTRDDHVWAAIADRVDHGNRLFSWSSRLLMVSLSSPPLALVTALLAGMLITFVCVARLGEARHATTVLVSVGPLVPLVGARIAFGRHVDPAGLMAPAAPMAAGRVASARALMATVIACLAGIVVSPLTTLDASDSIVWLLPALALSAISVAIATYVDSTLPVVAFAIGWLAVVGAWLGDVPRSLRGLSVDGLATDRPAVQAALLVATVAAFAVCVVRRDADPNWRTLP